MDFYLTIRLWARGFYKISIIVEEAEGRNVLQITIPVISGLNIRANWILNLTFKVVYASLSVSKISTVFNSRRRKCPPFFLRGLIIYLFITVSSKLRRNRPGNVAILSTTPSQKFHNCCKIQKKKAMETRYQHNLVTWWERQGAFFLAQRYLKEKGSISSVFFSSGKALIGDEVVLFLVSRKTKSEMAKLP